MYSLPSMSAHSTLPKKPKELTFEFLNEKFTALQTEILAKPMVKSVDFRATNSYDITSSNGEAINSVGRIAVTYKDGLGSFIIYIWSYGGTYKWSWLCPCGDAEEQRIYEWLRDIQKE